MTDNERPSADETEGHSFRGWSDRELKTDVEPLPPAPDVDSPQSATDADDTEGHSWRGWSDRELKTDVEPLPPAPDNDPADSAAPNEDDDTEGSIVRR